TPAQRAIYREIMVSTYNLFLKRVVSSRNVPLADIKQMAGGRVWTGHRALEGKLVDEIGGLTDALNSAAKEASLPPEARPKIVRLPISRNIVEFFLSGAELQARAPTMFDSRLALHAPALGSPHAPPQLREIPLSICGRSTACAASTRWR
ncbi:MAG: S49 family peptidase, partial [Candidatus Brocadiia bacterium]|nr:S49 family peptidase [Candidatus Brocadiia bacterium]